MALPIPEIDSRTSLLEVDKGQPFTYQPVATGSPTLWEAINLPAGLTINNTSGNISGSPTTPGLYGVLLRASNFDERTFTVDTATDVFTCPGHSYADGDLLKIKIAASGVAPAPLTVSDQYEVRDSNQATGTFKLAAKAGGVALNITTAGTGTLTASKRQTDEITLLIPVMETGSTLTNDDITFEMNVDVVTGAATFLGVEGVNWGPPTAAQRDDGLARPVLLVKKGDRFPVAIGFTRNGLLQDLDLATLRLGSKEYVPESLLDLTDGSFEKLGSGRSTRYRVVLEVGEDVWRGVLSSYEDDTGTYVDSHAEVQFTILNKIGQGNINDTQVHGIQSIMGSQVRQQLFNFTGLPQDAGPVVYTLTLNMTMFGRERQNAQVVKTFDVTYSGGAFTWADNGGTNTHSPATENAAVHWDSTLEFIDVTPQGSQGVTVKSRVYTSDESDGVVLELRLSGSGWYVDTTTLHGPDAYLYNSLYWSLWEVIDMSYYDSSTGGYNYSYENQWGEVLFSDSDSVSVVKASLEAAADTYYGNKVGDDWINNVFFDPYENIIRINMDGSLPLHMMQEVSYWFIGPFYRTINYNGHSHNVRVTANLAAAAAGQDDVWTKTSSTFILRVSDDLIADGNA
jgi:hypothetical protein